MQPHPILLRTVCIALASTVFSGCSELPGISGSPNGAIQISAFTSGASADRDPDGFTVSLDDGGPGRLPVTGLSLKGITAGSHSVKIGGIAPNCSVKGDNPRSVEVVANKEESVSFEIPCQPNVGVLTVTAVTTGEEISQSGYSVVTTPSRQLTVPANGVVTIPDVRVGSLNVTLSNIPPNCDFVSSSARTMQIVFGTNTEVAFTLHCVATGSFHITTTTSGVEVDATGYVVDVSLPSRGTQSQITLPATGSTDIKGLPPGDYALRLSDLANNCSAMRSVFSAVTLVAGAITTIAFDVNCVATKQIAYYVTKNGTSSRIRVINSNSTADSELASQTGANLDPDWSPDGSRLAFTSDRDGRQEVYTMDGDGRNVVRLTNVAGPNYRPAWSPDGKKIAFVSGRDGNPEIYVMDADGGNQVRTTSNDGIDGEPAWSPDGRRLAFQSDRDGDRQIWIMNADGSAPFRLTGSISGDGQPAWSPDGKKIAFSRSPSPTFRDIYMSDVDGSNLAQVSFNYPDASDPAWSPDGSQIAFSAKHCNDSWYSWYYYDTVCEVDIVLARTDGSVMASTPVLAPGYNPAWRR